jgi:hypothetical protein
MADTEIKALFNSNGYRVNSFVGVDVDDQKGDYGSITATVFDPNFVEDGEILTPSETPSGNQPPLPDDIKYLGHDSTNFNHLELPRLQNKVSEVITYNVYKTEIIIGSQNVTPCFNILDLSRPISGPTIGSIELVETEGFTLDPIINDWNQGTSVTINVYYNSNYSELLYKAFIVSNPQYVLDSNGVYRLTLSIGDELDLLSKTTRVRGLYCGPDPSFASDAANIYAKLNGLKTRVFPTGHKLESNSINNFYNDSPYDFLQDLYAPVNRDIRTNREGVIIAPIRKDWSEENKITLNYKEVLQFNANFSQFYEPFTLVKASNDYTINKPFGFVKTSFRNISGNPENIKPWFQGGYQETITNITNLGDTEIYKQEVTYGYVPTDDTPWPKALVEEDPCTLAEWEDLTFQIINTKTKALTYYPNGSSSYIVNKEETWDRGKKLKKRPDEDYDLFDDTYEYTLTTFTNNPQVNSDVCSKDYIQLLVNKRTETYNLDEDFSYRFFSYVQEDFVVEGVSANSGQTSFTGSGQTWTKYVNEGQLDEETGIIINQPTRVLKGEEPSISNIISPLTVEITNFSEYTLGGVSPLEPTPLSAPFCFNTNQLDTVSKRYLTEQYGLSNSITVVTSITNPIELNDSIEYIDKNGNSKKYLVWNIEYNQTKKQMTKTLTLLKTYEN